MAMAIQTTDTDEEREIVRRLVAEFDPKAIILFWLPWIG